MDLHQLKTFYYVATLLNFSKAAQKVSLSQPAVSRQMEALENYFGLDLFYRINKKIELTDAGRRLLKYTEEMLMLEEKTKRDMESIKSIDSGEIVIGAGTSIGNYFLSPLIMDFSCQFPKINCKLIIDNTSTILEKLRNGIIDIAIVAEPTFDPNYFYEALVHDEIILLSTNKERYKFEKLSSVHELNNEVFILRNYGSNTRKCINNLFEKLQFVPLKIVEFSSNEAIKQAVINGNGIGALSKITVQLELQSKVIFPIPVKEQCKRQFFLVNHKGKYMSPIILKFKDFIMERINHIQ
ncbi:LysR family transcriptional regulator [Evansella sp. AB-P1]|uniref:LysR family transcriptional regulator n=1 Tax=Evansella sp. AB-P1 TaxID=3037653 RepID=UPI00241D3030|nr:LysR family transcriptional regulator [Evansella sp. AB-P1]MDG5787260.1 LysR family transcriptional regulator [Evansella sp. AB-P1]